MYGKCPERDKYRSNVTHKHYLEFNNKQLNKDRSSSNTTSYKDTVTKPATQFPAHYEH